MLLPGADIERRNVKKNVHTQTIEDLSNENCDCVTVPLLKYLPLVLKGNAV